MTNTPVVTQFAAGTGLTQGGLSLPKGVAIDGLGHVWVVNGVSATSGGVSEFTVNTTGTPTITPLSPAGSATTIPVYGFGSAYGYQNPIQPVIDPSGNVWIATSAGSILNMLVGGAAPVVTPFASQIAKTSIGIRP
jgi:secreted PhoX family phosphatase